MAGKSSRESVPWWVAGGLLFAGAVTIGAGLLMPVSAASFGWFAYQPLADATFVPGGNGVVVSRFTIVGSVIFALGSIALAFLAGRRAGKRWRD